MTKAIKLPLINSLPSDQASRDRLRRVVNEAVDLRIQIKDLQEQLKDVVTVEKESHQIEPKFLKTLINAQFDYQYQAEKKRKQLEDQVEQMNEADILMGRSNPANIVPEDEDEDEPEDDVEGDETETEG